eukprot:14506137-Alexandrium_andersonii.AAC.1
MKRSSRLVFSCSPRHLLTALASSCSDQSWRNSLGRASMTERHTCRSKSATLREPMTRACSWSSQMSAHAGGR